MTVMKQTETVIVVGVSAFTVRVGTGVSDRSMSVTIALDGRVEWTYAEPVWRPLAYGYGYGCAYIWSAREVIVLPAELGADPDVLQFDEDLLLVFRVESGWLLVCETSVRLVVGREEISKVELGDVVEQARWEGGNLLVEDDRGITTRIGVGEGRLTT